MNNINTDIRDAIYFFGYLTIATCLIIIFFQFFTLLGFLKNKDIFLKNRIYYLIICIEIIEFIHQIVLLIGGICFVISTKPPLIIERILGALAGSCYIFVAVLQFYLSLTRFNTFFNCFIISKKSTKKIFIRSTIILTFIYICIFTFYSTDLFRIDISIIECGWYFFSNEKNYNRLFFIDATVYLSLSCLTLISFIAVVIKIYCKRIGTKNSTINRKKSISHLLEIRLFFQAIINFIYTAILQAFFVFGRIWFPTYEHLFRILNFTWVLSIGCNTFLNLIFLKDIRIGFLKQFKCIKNKNNNTKISSYNSRIQKATQEAIRKTQIDVY